MLSVDFSFQWFFGCTALSPRYLMDSAYPLRGAILAHVGTLLADMFDVFGVCFSLLFVYVLVHAGCADAVEEPPCVQLWAVVGHLGRYCLRYVAPSATHGWHLQELSKFLQNCPLVWIRDIFDVVLAIDVQFWVKFQVESCSVFFWDAWLRLRRRRSRKPHGLHRKLLYSYWSCWELFYLAQDMLIIFARFPFPCQKRFPR